MRLCSTAATLALLTVLFHPILATAANRGPSTAEERKQALDYIHDYENSPLDSKAIKEREWVMKWIIEVPDIHVTVCLILDKLPKGDKQDSTSIFDAEVLSQAAYAINNPDANDNHQAEFLAGVNGALHVYEALLKDRPKDREPYLDDLVQRRDAGTLAQFVQERAAASCKQTQ